MAFSTDKNEDKKKGGKNKKASDMRASDIDAYDQSKENGRDHKPESDGEDL